MPKKTIRKKDSKNTKRILEYFQCTASTAPTPVIPVNVDEAANALAQLIEEDRHRDEQFAADDMNGNQKES